MKRPAAYAGLFAGLLLVSTSGPFIVSTRMDAYAVVFLRTALAAAIFAVWAAAQGGLRIGRAHVARTVAGGVLLGAHFLLWVKAFDLTDFASNLLLLVSQPVIAAGLGIGLGERPTRDTWIALALAGTGLAIITGGDFALGPRALAGDLMCVLGSFAIALFYVVTRDARAATPLPAFMAATMAIAAATAVPVLLIAGTPFAYPARSWGWLGALVVFTTVGGHGLMNLVARHLKLFTVNVVIVMEPAIGIALGAAMFGAKVTALQAGGGALLCAAVVIGLRTERLPAAA